MCSVIDDLDGLVEPLEDGGDSISTTCKKCNSPATILIRKKDTYCNVCFLAATDHKFRASLGKNKAVRANSRVLLALSGGIGSSVLLHLVKKGIIADSHKKLRIEPVCLYLEEQLADTCKDQNKADFFIDLQKKYQLPIFIGDLSDYFTEKIELSEPNLIPTLNTKKRETFHNFINDISSQSGRKDFILKAKRDVMLNYAKLLNCSYILTADTSTTLASRMLSSLAIGRGAQVEHDVAFCDSRDPDVKILRPMKDISSEELQYYANLQNIEYITNKDLPDVSLQTVIHKFVVDLQDNFQSTISTICKTSEKMGNHHSSDQETCIICQSTLDTADKDSSALQATEFSRLVSSTGPQHFPMGLDTNNLNTNGKCENCSCSTKVEITREDIEVYLCYGCRLIIREIKDCDLPSKIKNLVITRRAINSMKNEINDFLI